MDAKALIDTTSAMLRARLPEVEAEIADLDARLAQARQIRRGILVALGEAQSTPRPYDHATPKERQVMAAAERLGLDLTRRMPRGARVQLAAEAGTSLHALNNYLGYIRARMRVTVYGADEGETKP